MKPSKHRPKMGKDKSVLRILDILQENIPAEETIPPPKSAEDDEFEPGMEPTQIIGTN